MSFRTLAMIATDRMADAPTLEAALALAERERAHLDVHALGVEQIQYSAMPIDASATLLERDMAEARSQSVAVADWARKAIGSAPVGTTVEEGIVRRPGMAESMGRLLRYADLVCATQPYAPGATEQHVAAFEGALFSSGAPVMVLPAGAKTHEGPRRIMIAWDESDGALRAVRQALPFLREGDGVEVSMVAPPAHSAERSDPGGSLCIMLARHGVRAEVSVLARAMPRISEDLLRHARESGADLLVMGAYGHSRLREAMLGGVTREVLAAAELPLLMAR